MNQSGRRTSWLQRLPFGLFGMVLGLLSLSSAWRRLAQLDPDAPSELADGLQGAGLVLQALLLLLMAGRVLRYPRSLLHDFRHPLHSAMLALCPVSLLFSVILLQPAHPGWHSLALLVVVLALGLQAVLAWKIVGRLSTGRMPPDQISPALYLPIVPGGFVGAMAVSALGYPGFAMLLFGMGISGWALLEVRILNRLYAGPLPLSLRPTLGIEIAPATVGTLTMLALWPQLPVEVVMICLGISSGPLFAVLTRWHAIRETPFSAGFWSFSFPLAAMAASVVEAVQRGHWPLLVAWAAVLLVTGVVLVLTVRTLRLLWQGRLLPAA